MKKMIVASLAVCNARAADRAGSEQANTPVAQLSVQITQHTDKPVLLDYIQSGIEPEEGFMGLVQKARAFNHQDEDPHFVAFYESFNGWSNLAEQLLEQGRTNPESNTTDLLCEMSTRALNMRQAMIKFLRNDKTKEQIIQTVDKLMDGLVQIGRRCHTYNTDKWDFETFRLKRDMIGDDLLHVFPTNDEIKCTICQCEFWDPKEPGDFEEEVAVRINCRKNNWRNSHIFHPECIQGHAKNTTGKLQFVSMGHELRLREQAAIHGYEGDPMVLHLGHRCPNCQGTFKGEKFPWQFFDGL